MKKDRTHTIPSSAKVLQKMELTLSPVHLPPFAGGGLRKALPQDNCAVQLRLISHLVKLKIPLLWIFFSSYVSHKSEKFHTTPKDIC